MSLKPKTSSFMNGVRYLDHLRYNGANNSSLTIINRRFEFSKTLYDKNLFAHYGCVNAIEFSNDGQWLVSGGDDKRVLLWNVGRALSNSCTPKSMNGEHNSNIFCLGFNSSHTKILSAGNDEQVLLHDISTSSLVDIFLHSEAVYGLATDPNNDTIFASACDDGKILIWDTRQSDSLTLAHSVAAYHAVMYNPIEPRLLATANAKEGVCLWDTRKPKTPTMRYGSALLSHSAMSVRFNCFGTHLLALRRKFSPILYDVTSPKPLVEFDHQEYYNSCTMKSCCFAGDRDQYIISGSDDFKLYVWKMPDMSKPKDLFVVNKAHFVLRGHRSIVNQVRYNNMYGLLASSGVEKIIKLWSPFPLTYVEDNNYISKTDHLRRVYSYQEYINLVLETGQFMTHDYSTCSVQEDPRMMAFFDSLVQRDIEGWTTDSSDEVHLTKNTSYEVQSLDSSTSFSELASSDSDDDQTRNGKLIAKILKPAAKLAQQVENPERVDPSLDRISILIAAKRREQKSHKLSKIHCKYQKQKKMLKTSSENPNISVTRGVEPNLNVNNNIQFSQAKDKRKLLHRKRAKLSRDTKLDINSSDSDDSRKIISNVLAYNCDNNPTVVCDMSIGQNIPSTSLNYECMPLELNEICDFQTNNNENLSYSNETLKGLDPSIIEKTSPSEVKNSSIAIKNKKQNGRNYRKRNADNADE